MIMPSDPKHGHSRSTWLWSALIVFVILGVAYLLLRLVADQSSQFEPAVSWHGITPGHTSIQEALAVLGPPDSQGQRNIGTRDYNIYAYINRSDQFSAQFVEIWTEKRGNPEVVIGIFRGGNLSDISSLGQLVSDYQQPDKVSWHHRCSTRFLVWAQKGIGAQAWTYGRPSWDNPVSEMLLFEPMSLAHFLQTPWPYFKPPPMDGQIFWEQNPCNNDYPNPDFGAEDPYDWTHMPTAIPVQ